MAEVMEMPKLSDTMTEGVVAAWHKKVGDTVATGELIAEIETDKATMDLESFFDGTVLHLGIAEGGAIGIGALLVIIGENGEDVSDIVAKYAATAKAEEKASTTENKEIESEPVVAAPVTVSSPAQEGVQVSSTTEGGRIKASPLAKAMAKERGIDLSRVNGTGDNGRIIKKDIEDFKEGAYTAPAASNFVPGTESFRDEPTSQMRKTIARRLADSKFTAPHFYLTMEIDMGNAVTARASLNEIAPVKISYNDLVIKAVAAALRKHPKVNSSWLGDAIRYYDHVHVGMAVAVEDGLLVPVIRFADQKSLVQISQEAKELAGKARDRKLQPAEWEGNTFTISNLGMFGIEDFTAIINPPDACILAIGGIIDKPVVKNGEVVPGKTMKVTLSCDHRVVDGASGSEFLRTLKGFLEDPVRILL